MTKEEILGHVDHTLLRPTAVWQEICKLCEEGLRYKTASVCIPPSFVARAKKAFPALKLGTVVGFPLGYDTTAAKRAALEQALLDGAEELDMVVNLGDVKNGDFAGVTEEISLLKQVAGTRVLKVIIECCYLCEGEKTALCRCVTEGGADFIKTSTGLAGGGATPEDVKLLLAHVGQGVGVKASGGIRTREDMELYLSLGCGRLGTSSAVAVLCAD